MKTIVYYYSRNGSNNYLANEISKALQCDIEPVRPVLNAHLPMLFGLSPGNRKLKRNPGDYEMVILCGPIWMGKLIPPLRDFILNQRNRISRMVFVSCCGSNFEMKNDKFGHGLVFNKVRSLMGEKCIHCEAFPIGLVLPDDKKDIPDVVMKTRLSDANFKGDIRQYFDAFIEKIRQIQ